MPKKFTKVAVHALIRKSGKILIMHRALVDVHMPGYWDLPGGTVYHGENKITALKRELKEETGLRVNPGKIISVYEYLSGPYRHQWQLVFECRYVSGRIKLNPVDHDAYKWVTLKELRKYKKIGFLNNYYKELTA